MMKVNKKLITIGIPILTVVMACSIALFHVPQMNEVNADTEKAIKDNFPEMLKNAESGEKSETVYAVMDADGEIGKISVSEWLKNENKSDKLSDYSKLKNIENTSGDEKVSRDGNMLVWDANGKDISYTGEYTGELPVKVKISYYLDGTRMSADEIAGKKGDVQIRFDYDVSDSITRNGYDMTRPYAIMSMVVLNNDHFSNVTVNNGKTINDGGNTTVVGIALPGMSDNLDMGNLDIPDNVIINARTTEFEIDGTYTVADSGFMNDVDTSKIDNAGSEADELESAMNELLTASGKLVKGSSELIGSAGTLADSSDQIEDRTKTLKDGTGKLKSGASDLKSGASGLKNDIKKLSDGADALGSSVADLDGRANNVNDEIDKLSETLVQQNAELEKTAKSVCDNLADVNTGAVIIPSSEEMDRALENAVTYAKASGDQDAFEAVCELKAAIESYEKSVDNAFASANIDKKKVENAKQTADEMYGSISASSVGDIEQLKDSSKNLVDGIDALDISVNRGYEKEDGTRIPSLISAVSSLNEGAEKLYSGAGKLNEDVIRVDTRAGKIVTHMGQLTDNAGKLADGANTLTDKMYGFNRSGIQKMVSTIRDTDIKGMLNRVAATIEAASDGSFVGGKLEDQSGESKLIFKTGEVKKVDE